jgi:hypothetical protein
VRYTWKPGRLEGKLRVDVEGNLPINQDLDTISKLTA